MSDLISECLRDSTAIISVMGPHAGESSECIFRRKIQDISRVGWTLWLIRSYKAKPDIVQRMSAKRNSGHVLFVEPSSPGGARPTKTAGVVSEYSPDRTTWTRVPKGISRVTGKLDGAAYALVFDRLELCSDGVELDLWEYADYAQPHLPMKTALGCSTVCVSRQDLSKHRSHMKSRYRAIVACARLRAPAAVWVR